MHLMSVVKIIGSERSSSMGSCATSCVKYLLFAFSLLSAIFGIAVVVLGSLNLTAHLQNNKVSEFLSIAPIVLLVIGGIIVVISFFGCCGALCESRCMLLTFASLIICVFVVELLGGIAFYSLYNEETINAELKNSLSHYNTDKDIKQFWDVVNDDLHCCGVESVDDWGENIPNSCCKDIDINDICHKEQAYETGCLEVMVKYFKHVAPILFSVIVALQLLSIIFALCVGRSRNYETV